MSADAFVTWVERREPRHLRLHTCLTGRTDVQPAFIGGLRAAATELAPIFDGSYDGRVLASALVGS